MATRRTSVTISWRETITIEQTALRAFMAGALDRLRATRVAKSEGHTEAQ